MDEDEAAKAAEDAAIERLRALPDFDEADFDEEECRRAFREGRAAGRAVGYAEGLVKGVYDRLNEDELE
jgi:hypothetical protein